MLLTPALGLLTSATVSIAAVSSLSFTLSSRDEPSGSLTARYIEGVGIEDPSSYYPFIEWLTSNRLPVPFAYQAPELAPKLDAEGSPLKSQVSETNPIFTRLLEPNETWKSLELNLARGRFLRDRGELELLHFGLANGQSDAVLEEMKKAWMEREEVVKAIGESGSCESWIDVKGHRACSVKEFWNLVGAAQQLRMKVINVEAIGDDLAPLPFDRLQPAIRDDTLPFFVLYASTTDESFPTLFDELSFLSGNGPEGGDPRAQFSIRWKPDSRVPEEQNKALSSFGVAVGIKNVRTMDEATAEDLRPRLLENFNPLHPVESFTYYAAHSPILPSLIPELEANTTLTDLKLNESLTVNGVSLDLNLDRQQLIGLLRRERDLIADLKSLHRDLTHGQARELLIAGAANAAEQLQGRSPKNVIKPSDHNPLRVVNLVQAMQDLPAMFVDLGYLESVESDGEAFDENEEPPADKPASTTLFLIADLESAQGNELVQEALAFLDGTPEVRLNFVHNPELVDFAPHRHSFTNLLYRLIESGTLREIYPAEVLTWLIQEVPADGFDEVPEIWEDAENPMSAFVLNGADEAESEAAKEYWTAVQAFAVDAGIAPGQSALVINGRVVELKSGKFATYQFQQIAKYEYEQRIQSVVNLVNDIIPDSIKEDRHSVALIYSSATSVISSSLLPVGTPLRAREYLSMSEDYPSITVQEREKHALWEVGAVLDPLSVNAQKWFPILQSLHNTEQAYLRFYPIVSQSPRPTRLYSQALPITPRFDESTMKETAPRVMFEELPSDLEVESVIVEMAAGQSVSVGKDMVGKKVGDLGARDAVIALNLDASQMAEETTRIRDEL